MTSRPHIYPKGLAGKSFLDAGCNAGGYCFVAKDLGAKETLGFDPRDHWIKQAEFCKRHRSNTEGMTFRTIPQGRLWTAFLALTAPVTRPEIGKGLAHVRRGAHHELARAEVFGETLDRPA